MHRLEFRADEMMDLDKTLCELHSLGSIITHVCYLERFTTDQAALADMGRLVSEKANIAPWKPSKLRFMLKKGPQANQKRPTDCSAV